MAPDVHADEYGRCFCKAHMRAVCHECCYSFAQANEYTEIAAGLRQPKPRVDELALQVCECERGLAHIRTTGDTAFWDENVRGLETGKAEIAALLRSRETTQAEVDTAMRKVREKHAAADSERRAMYQAWKVENPGKTVMEAGGKEAQRFFDAIASAPPSASVDAVDKRVCSWCDKSHGAKKLLVCGGCRQVSYCNVECQRAAWAGHKPGCRACKGERAGKKKVKLPLTWEQLEAYGSAVEAKGQTLEVRVVEDQSVLRQVFACKDRAGLTKIIAVYADDRIPDLASGKVMRWKNPRFHFFLDGSSGGRIEQSDLANISVE